MQKSALISIRSFVIYITRISAYHASYYSNTPSHLNNFSRVDVTRMYNMIFSALKGNSFLFIGGGSQFRRALARCNPLQYSGRLFTKGIITFSIFLSSWLFTPHALAMHLTPCVLLVSAISLLHCNNFYSLQYSGHLFTKGIITFSIFLSSRLFEAPICSRSLIISCLLPGFRTYLLSTASCILVNIAPGMPMRIYTHITSCIPTHSSMCFAGLPVAGEGIHPPIATSSCVDFSLVSNRSMELGVINTPCDYLLPPPAIHTLLRL